MSTTTRIYGPKCIGLLMLVIMAAMMAGCDGPGAKAERELRAESASNEVRQALESTGIDPDGDYSTEYCQVELQNRESMFNTALVFPPRTNEWTVGSAADVLNLAAQHGWQMVWISSDGSQVIVRRDKSKGSGMYATISEKASASQASQ